MVVESWSKDAPLDMIREELLDKMIEATGRNLSEYRAVLKLLAHPDIIKSSLAYLQAMDFGSRCRRYEAPWSCIRDAEASYENLREGGLAGASSFLNHGMDSWWCENCRQKVMGS